MDCPVGTATMFEVQAILVEEPITREKFRCDVEKCHGACCCIAGWRGAPLADSEIEAMTEAVPQASRYLTARNLAILASKGAYEGRPGDYATVCVDDRECVFVYFDERGIARCAFERAFDEGLTTWRKPLSCHLFPIRVRNNGREFLHYEEIPECQTARERGRTDDVPVYEFLREPLTRLYGPSWYEAFRDACFAHPDHDSTQNR